MNTTAVIILNWNGERYLERFLPSLVAHTPDSVRLVVADNGSTDRSREVVAHMERVEFLNLGRNWGFAEGNNRAVEMVDADYVMLLNNDIEVTEGWLTPLIDLLDREPQTAVAGVKLLSESDHTLFEYAGAAGGFIDYLGYPFCRGRILQTVERDCGQYDDCREVFWVSGAAFFVRRNLYMEMGGFCSDFFAHQEEIDFCWRVQLAGYRVMVCPASAVYHVGAGTLTIGSPQKVFLNHRNNLAMIFRCATTAQRAVAAVARPLLDFTAALTYLLQGRAASFCAVFRAYRDFLRWHPRLIGERRAIQQAKVQNSKQIYFGGILARYIFRKRFDKLM